MTRHISPRQKGSQARRNETQRIRRATSTAFHRHDPGIEYSRQVGWDIWIDATVRHARHLVMQENSLPGTAISRKKIQEGIVRNIRFEQQQTDDLTDEEVDGLCETPGTAAAIPASTDAMQLRLQQQNNLLIETMARLHYGGNIELARQQLDQAVNQHAIEQNQQPALLAGSSPLRLTAPTPIVPSTINEQTTTDMEMTALSGSMQSVQLNDGVSDGRSIFRAVNTTNNSNTNSQFNQSFK